MRKEIPPGAKISTPVFSVKWPSLIRISHGQESLSAIYILRTLWFNIRQ